MVISAKISLMIKKIRKKYQHYLTYKAKKKKDKKFVYYIVETIETLLVAGLLALAIKEYVIQVSVVPTGSMIPTLIGGVDGELNDRLFVNKFIYDFKAPKRGDIVVFKSPHKDGKDYVKRCIGLPGETIKLVRGVVYIDNKELILAGVDVQRDYSFFKPVTIPQGHYFVLGDNRSMSQDSRYWGFVPRKDIIGKALFTFWPFKRMKPLK